MRYKISKVLNDFFQLEYASSILLGFSLIAALFLANIPASGEVYFQMLHVNFLGMSVQHWINDGLMVIFFYLVGMEIKKEFISGALSSKKKAALPFFAALGGMIIPAFLFYFINQEAEAKMSWGIPMATDIAFALGALVALGSRAPTQLKALLLALAVVDDLGAILVIVFFYSNKINLLWFFLALALVFINWHFNKKKNWSWSLHTLLGISAWACMLFSGVHATLIGVIWGLITPDDKTEHAPLDKSIHFLHPYVGFIILPIFALANSGVQFPPSQIWLEVFRSSLFVAIVVGLFVGKPLGVFIFSWFCVLLKIGELPKGIRWSHILAMGILAGIGFTMSLFISHLSIHDKNLLDISKIAILIASLLAGALGSCVLFTVGAIKKLK